MSLTSEVKHKAVELGFDIVGVTDAAPLAAEHVEKLKEWLDRGYAGRMDYMHKNLEKRISPGRLLPGAKSVICVGLNYHRQEQPDRPGDSAAPAGRVANYARYQDYHLFIKRLLRDLTEFIKSGSGQNVTFKTCVDSVPIAERSFAARAGLGFIGKNHMLINPELGPEILLGEIVTDLELEPDETVAVNCASCDRCIRACPTAALRADGQLDAARCISYLTIEHTGPLDAELTPKVENNLFGCDRCVLACPYYSRAPACANKALRHYPQRSALNLNEILTLSEESFRVRFADSPIKRTGLQALKRNAEICLKNASQPN